MSKLFLGGMPTTPDVKTLRDRFSPVLPGDQITHEDIESAIGCKRDTSRYRTVTDAWRKSLFTNDNLDVAAVPGIGFRCLTSSERAQTSVKSFQGGIRKVAKSIRRAATIRRDELTDAEGVKLDHLNRYGARIVESATEMMKEIKTAPKQESLPRREPPGGRSND